MSCVATTTTAAASAASTADPPSGSSAGEAGAVGVCMCGSRRPAPAWFSMCQHCCRRCAVGQPLLRVPRSAIQPTTPWRHLLCRGGGVSGGGAVAIGRRVFVSNLAFSTTWQASRSWTALPML